MTVCPSASNQSFDAVRCVGGMLGDRSISSSAAFIEYFCCPEGFAAIDVEPERTAASGYFAVGDAVAFGRLATSTPAAEPTDTLPDAIRDVAVRNGRVVLPFDLTEIVTNLRHERYRLPAASSLQRILSGHVAQRVYYGVRPYLRVQVRKQLQKLRFRGWQNIPFPRWPLDTSVDSTMQSVMRLLVEARGEPVPFIWFWPEGASGCAMVTHDVEGQAGLDLCDALMDLDDQLGFKSAFQLIPEGQHAACGEAAAQLRSRGFEVNLHDLNHDGHLFTDKARFLERAERINHYAREMGCAGFRSAVMYRQQAWFSAFDFEYDMSVPNVAHLEPQRGGCCTVMPYFVNRVLELPLTTSQDYTLFHILNDYSLELWQEQIRRIVAQHGLISILTHPDYLVGSRERDLYTQLLRHVADVGVSHGLWLALPGAVNHWWRARQAMRLVRKGADWRVEGPESERARVAYATMRAGRLEYSLSAAETRVV